VYVSEHSRKASADIGDNDTPSAAPCFQLSPLGRANSSEPASFATKRAPISARAAMPPSGMYFHSNESRVTPNSTTVSNQPAVPKCVGQSKGGGSRFLKVM